MANFAVRACCCAVCRSSGSLSAAPFGSDRRLGGRCGLYAYSCLGVSWILPCAAMPAGGLFFRVAVLVVLDVFLLGGAFFCWHCVSSL